MAKSLQEIRVHVDRFTDSCRRFFFTLERWCDGCPTPGLEGVDWEWIRTLEVNEINAAFLSLGRSIEILFKECADLEPGKYQIIIKSAATLSKWAFEEAKTGPFDEHFGGHPGIMYNSDIILHFRKAVGLLSFFADLMELQEMHVSRREVLQVLLENGPTKGPAIAELATGADAQDSSFRDMLADMVKEDLLRSGKGRYSTGYRLSDRGMQLAQLSGQLKDF